MQSVNRQKVKSPKKNAIHTGIRVSKGEIAMLTDADCLPPQGWIKGTMRYFSPDVGMVIGFSPYEAPEVTTLNDHLIALDSLALAAVAAGSAGWGRPVTCNGRYLSYRNKVYQQVGGFTKIEEHISGDDDLFLKLVRTKTDWQILFAYDKNLIVPTFKLNSLRTFFNQRVRHASKGFHYELGQIVALGAVYFLNAMLLFSLPLIFLGFYLPLFCLLFKAGAEFMLTSFFAVKMDRSNFLKVFPIAAIIHIPYVVLFGALGQFGKFSWKPS